MSGVRAVGRLVAAAALLLLASCAQDDAAQDDTATGDARSGGLEGSVAVAAATSLTEALQEVAGDFTAAHPDVEITFTFDSSAALTTQIQEGAPVDVFASADAASMAELVDAGLVVGDPAIVAGNELVIVTKPGNPDGIASLADLADLAASSVISLCDADAPCGRYAATVLGDAGISIAESHVTRGQNAGTTLAAVADGDAAAGIVYATDAQAARSRVDAVALPAAVNVVATYPIAVLDGARTPAADAFVAYLLGDDAQAVLAAHGFLPAP